MDRSVIYFAYGSNMFVPRLENRVGTVEVLGRGRLVGHQLRFHKRSADGSGKCDAFHTGHADDVVEGVLFAVAHEGKAALDKLEGANFGYAMHTAKVATDDGEALAALYTAQADSIDQALKPYGWYRDIVLRGARQHWLPEAYIAAAIAGVAAIPDPEPAREAARRAEAGLA